jgi:hypothetical protein
MNITIYGWTIRLTLDEASYVSSDQEANPGRRRPCKQVVCGIGLTVFEPVEFAILLER